MKKITISLLVLMMLLSLTACSNKNEDKNKAENVRTVTDVRGEVSIPTNPQRIVDLSGNSDMLYLLGYNVVGTANSDAYDQTKVPSYLEDALKDAKILGYSYNDTMDTEAIFALNPDLVIISTRQEKMYEQLSAVVPTVMIQLEELDWKEDFKSLAKIMDKEDVATKWLEEYKERAQKIGEKVKETCGEDTTYLSFLASGDQFFVFTGAGLGNVMYEDLGLKAPENLPVQDNVSLPVVNYEGLSAIGADYLFPIGTEEDLKKLEDNKIFQGMEQVKAGNYTLLPASPYFNQGYSPIGREKLLDEIEERLEDANK